MIFICAQPHFQSGHNIEPVMEQNLQANPRCTAHHNAPATNLCSCQAVSLKNLFRYFHTSSDFVMIASMFTQMVNFCIHMSNGFHMHNWRRKRAQNWTIFEGALSRISIMWIVCRRQLTRTNSWFMIKSAKHVRLWEIKYWRWLMQWFGGARQN